MRKFKAVVAIALASVMVAGFAGCGSSGDAPAASSTDGNAEVGTEEASDAGTEGTSAETAGSSDLNVMIETPVESLDPQVAQDGTSLEVIANFTDGLTQMDADGQTINALAESYEISDDGLTYTFHIREDANWSNGTPVTANDFVFAWRRAVDPAVASEYSYMLSDIGQVKNAAEIIAGERIRASWALRLWTKRHSRLN